MILFFIILLCIFTTSGSAATITEVDSISERLIPLNTPSGDIWCNETGERVFCSMYYTDYDSTNYHVLHIYSFDGSDLVGTFDVTFYNWSIQDVKSNTKGDKIFLAVAGRGGYPESGYSGLYVLNYNLSSVTAYSVEAYSGVWGSIQSIGYNEDDDVVFAAFGYDGIRAFKNNGTAYTNVSYFTFGYDEHKAIVWDYYTNNIYYAWDYDVAIMGWSTVNDTMWHKYEYGHWPLGYRPNEMIVGEAGAVFCPGGSVASGQEVPAWWVNSYADGLNQDDWYHGYDEFGIGLCWLGKNYGRITYIAIAHGKQTYGDYQGLLIGSIESEADNEVEQILEYQDSDYFFYDVASTANNFGNNSINSYIFALSIRAGYNSDPATIVYSISGLNSPPVFSDPDPIDEAMGVDTDIGSWNITINDPDGDNFNYTIECSNGDTTSGNNVTNNTFSLSLSALAPSTTYTFFVNATARTPDVL